MFSITFQVKSDLPLFGAANALSSLLSPSLWGKCRGRVMSCRDTIHLICWYLEGRLSPVVETEIKRHLEGCSDCRLVLEAAVNTLDCYFVSERADATSDAFRAA